MVGRGGSGRWLKRRRSWVVAGIVALIGIVALAVSLLVAVLHLDEGRPLPTFGSLARTPDPSLHGTVAYYNAGTRCIRIVAAAGQPSKTVWCLPPEGPATWVKVGKPVGPQLVWLTHDRLEVTMFRMKAPSPGTKSYPGLGPGWQKIIDVGTGRVHDVPTADVPSGPNTTTQPTVDPNGERIRSTVNSQTGQVEVKLITSTGVRTLLAVHGPGEYGYQFGPVFWAPNWQWIAAADDGRILVITPGDRPVTRVLVTGSGGGAGGGTAGPTFAVTAVDLLRGTKQG